MIWVNSLFKSRSYSMCIIFFFFSKGNFLTKNIRNVNGFQLFLIQYMPEGIMYFVYNFNDISFINFCVHITIFTKKGIPQKIQLTFNV